LNYIITKIRQQVYCKKNTGFEQKYIFKILTGMPQSEFETIAWTKKPTWAEFRSDIERIVMDMIAG